MRTRSPASPAPFARRRLLPAPATAVQRATLVAGLFATTACFEGGSSVSSGATDGTGGSGSSGGTGAGTTAGSTSAGTTAGSTSAGTTMGSGSGGEGVCGNGVVEAGEACDDGNDVESDACLSTCEAAACGDGFVQEGVEVCDDGNTMDDDACNASCRVPGTVAFAALVDDVETFRGVALGGDDTIFVTGWDATQDAVTAAYEGEGAEVWRSTYDAGGKDYGRGIAVDPGDGSVVTVGYAEDTYQFGAFVVRHGEDGTQQWVLDQDPVLGWKDGQDRAGIAREVATDGSGDVWVAGDHGDPGTTTYVARIWRINGAGQITNTYDTDRNTGTCGEYWESIALAPGGDVLTAGARDNCPGSIDITTQRRSSSGTSLWVFDVDGDAGLDEAGRGVVGLADGSVTAGFVRVAANDMTAWIRRYDESGTALWTATHAGDGGGYDAASEVAADAAGHIFAAGWETTGGGEAINGWLVKLSPDGDEIWSRSFDQAGLDDYFFGLALDSAGDVVVVGQAEVAAGDTQGMIVKFDR